MPMRPATRRAALAVLADHACAALGLRLATGLPAALSTALPTASFAAEHGTASRYPDRPVALVNPYPSSGQVDVVARALAPALHRTLGQTVAISYRVGGASVPGIASVAAAAPDGYTLLLAAPSVITHPLVERLFDRTPAFETDHLLGVALIGTAPTVLVVHPALPVTQAKDFIELARARPGDMVFASGGLYGGTHLPMAMLARAARLQFKTLMAAGGGPAMTAVLSGHAAAYAASASIAAPHIKAGRLRPLAHWGSGRLPEFPELPSFKELGLDIEFNSWAALFVPAGTPPPVLQRLRDALRRATQDAEFVRAMSAGNQTIDYRDGSGFQSWFDEERRELAATVRGIGKVTE